MKIHISRILLPLLLLRILCGCSPAGSQPAPGTGTPTEIPGTQTSAPSNVSTADSEQGPRKVACVGDSLTWGQAQGQAQSAAPYPTVLQTLLGEQYEVRNFGASGRVLSEGYREAGWERSYNLTQSYRDSLAFQPDIVIICLGTNDAAQCDVRTAEGKEHFLCSAANLIADYRETGAEQIYLCLPPDNQNTAYQRTLRDHVIPLLRQAAEEQKLPLIDLYTPTSGQSEYLLPDRLHLTDPGYALLARLIHQALTE